VNMRGVRILPNGLAIAVHSSPVHSPHSLWKLEWMCVVELDEGTPVLLQGNELMNPNKSSNPPDKNGVLYHTSMKNQPVTFKDGLKRKNDYTCVMYSVES